jgi:hypothetical protein
MKNMMVLTTMLLAACSAATPSKTGAPTETAATRTQALAPTESVKPAQSVTPPKEEPVPVAGSAPPGDGLSEMDPIDKRTLGCSRAGLNAAAREAEKAPSRGYYQFSYFRIVSDSHHSVYEVRFKSNYHGEPDLKYCVSVYCQQGWDPRTSKTSVSLIGAGHQPTEAHGAGAAHGADCGDPQTRVKQRSKRSAH